MTLGKNLRTIREKKNLSQDELSILTGYDEITKTGVSQGAISAIEKRGSKASKHAPALAKALGVSINELIGEIKNYDTIQSTQLQEKQPTPILELQAMVVEHLSCLDQDDAEVWIATIRGAANKARKNKQETSNQEPAAKALDPPSVDRRTA